MKGQLLWINAALVLLLGYTAWTLVGGYRVAVQRYEIFRAADAPVEVPAPPEEQLVQPLRSENYLAIAQRMLFSVDRNPVVEVDIIEDEPEPTRPAFPYLAGLMDLGKGPVAWMAPEREGNPRPIRPGEKVGPFEFVGATESEIQLAWNDESFEVAFAEMTGSDEAPPAEERRSSRGTRSVPGSSGQPSGPRESPTKVEEPKRLGGQYNIGREVTTGVFAADPKDDSPDGTEYNGYVKRVQQSPFGRRQFWVKKP